MFRHTGKGRTYSHNLKLASILSGVAGVVNITGVLGLNTLTTNVTGHFAFFAEDIFLKNYRMAFVYLLYILFFLLGAFVSSLIMESVSKQKAHTSYVIPISIEIALLLAVSFSALFIPYGLPSFETLLSAALLFSMGLQNALVTRISQSVVRTTHLTGLFTDLGIELSQLFFYTTAKDKSLLNKSILLKLIIIVCFFTGCIIGGFLYHHFALKTLLLPAGLLLFVLWYDRLVFRYYNLKRKFRNQEV